MKKLIFLVTVFFTVTVMAQETDFTGTINWSILFPMSKKGYTPTIIGQDGESIYLIRHIKAKRYLEKYNLETLALEKGVEFDLMYEKKLLKLRNSFMFGGLPTLLMSYADKKTDITTVYMRTVDPATLKLGEPKKIQEYLVPEMKQSMLVMKRPSVMEILAQMSGTTAVTISENEEFAYAAALDPTLTKDEMEAGNFRVKGILMDSDGEILEQSLLEMPKDNLSVMQTEVSNEGLVYMLAYEMIADEEAEKKLIGGKNRLKKGPAHFVLYDVASGEMIDYPIDMEGREVEMMRFGFNPNGGVNVGGLTSVDGKGVTGSFFMKFDKDFNEVSTVVNDFEEDFITATWSEKQKENLEKKKDKGKEVAEPVLYDYVMDPLIMKADGSCLVLAEQYYVRVVTTSYTDANGNRHTTTTYYYYYNDIIAMNYNSAGELEWKQVIKKQQYSVNDGGYYSSYFVVPDGDKVHIVYNDEKSNYVDAEGMTIAEEHKLNRAIIGAKVTLAADGTVSKEKLFEFEEGGLKLVPKVCEAASDDLIFLYARSKKGDKLGTLKFDK